MPGMKPRTAVLAAVLAGSLAACGGGDSSPAAPPPPTPSPTPQRSLISEGAQSDLPPAANEGVAFIVVVQTQVTGTLEATVDWTFPSNPVALLWAQGNCIDNPNCAVLVQNSSAAKPKTITATNVAAGTYSLLVVNLGTTNESVSYQVFFIR